MRHVDSLKAMRLMGISSMLRDISLIAEDVGSVEQEIVSGRYPLAPAALRPLDVVDVSGNAARIGDVVVFEPVSLGTYRSMETLWGGRAPLAPGERYLGVICERRSSKLVTAALPERFRFGSAPLSLVAEAGGIGFATGVAQADAPHNGGSGIGTVRIIGGLFDPESGRMINMLDAPLLPCADESHDAPSILVVGTGTDVGKTTLATALLSALSGAMPCAALKASGTGWWEDSELHIRGGATRALNFTAVGLPTTYGIEAEVYRDRLRHLNRRVRAAEPLPPSLIPPALRRNECPRPEAVIVEHGGDLIEAGVPTYLSDPALMTGVEAIVICSESAVSLFGAIERLLGCLRLSGASPRLFASAPLINVDGFVRRVLAEPMGHLLSGIVDVAKPAYQCEEDWRLNYSVHHRHILSVPELIMELPLGCEKISSADSNLVCKEAQGIPLA
ncbi:ATP-dependent dethiobiotin synthetase BioD [Pandoraea terrae]|uniref:ATP-dependent dethiobiotin synthetase BioD n=1 Tax=Pandoraea terrae TaxID=1537710 RepID=A0A5E4SR68_9BURK|nr:dethiobiotin synthase [Pandoraea terrae]VVD76349.1 ATP-dependent dethiobiotin synthetase BioD [Pandoraea terrae]